MRRPIRNFGCRRRTLPVTQSPIASNGLLEAQPKSTFGLRHALPYHVCCDLALMLSLWHRPSSSLINPPSQSCSGSLLAVVSVSATSAERPIPPFKTTTAKSFTPPSLPLVECTVPTPLHPMCCYWPIWPRSDQEIDRSAGCQRSGLWATQTLGHLARGSGSRWISNGLSLRRESIFFSDLQTVVSDRPCSPVEPSCR